MTDSTPCNGLIDTKYEFITNGIADKELSPTPAIIEKFDSAFVDGENFSEVDAQESALPFVVKAPRANSKLILQNMEEVLNSVKKKHRQKHRRKREEKKKLAMLAEAEHAKEMLEANGREESGIVKDKETGSSSSSRHRTKKPLQEQQPTHEPDGNMNHVGKSKHHHHNSKRRKATLSPVKSVASAECNSASGSILQHIIRTPKKSKEKMAESEVQATKSDTNDKPSKRTTNAFEVMMNARNKSIGSNTPGKDSPCSTETSPVVGNGESISASKAKRKLLLQSWSERKGGLKRKIDEEMRAAYVEQQLNKRAKRFKNMLVNGGSSPSSSNNSGKEATSSMSVEENLVAKPNRRSKTLIRRSRRLSSTGSIEVKMTAKVDSETEEFLSKLSSPTKKRDSLLGYFSKVPSPKDVVSESTIKTKEEEFLKNNETDENHSVPPKRRGRPTKGRPSEIASTEEKHENSHVDSILSDQTPNGRPKRACAEKARYDYDLAESPTKLKEAKPSETMAYATQTPTNGKARQRKGKEGGVMAASSTPNSNCLSSGSVKIIKNSTTTDSPVIESIVINLDDSNPSSTTIDEMKTPKKLAPLFMRSLPKPSLDPELLKARQEFLRSGVPEKLRLEQEKQKQIHQRYEDLNIFPELSHLQQLSKEDRDFLTNCHQNGLSGIKLLEDLPHSPNDALKSRKRKSKTSKCSLPLIGITSCAAKDFRSAIKSFKGSKVMPPVKKFIGNFPTVINKRDIIKLWKLQFDRFPTYKCYNQLRDKYHFFSAVDSTQDTQQVTESFVVTRSTRRSMENTSVLSSGNQNGESPSEVDVKPPATAPNGELLFAEKYKPLLFEQVLVNYTPVSQLREFLASWATGSGANSLRNSQNYLDDSMDFMSDSNSSPQAVCNSVVLLGPVSSGKTNAVFTLANEMNFNVLEINAGMKRSGKKLIQELQEATQSHQIRKKDSSVGVSGKNKTHKNLLKMSLKGLKSKKQISGESNGDDNSESNNCDSSFGSVNDLNARKCLILIEDADIVFDQHDAGFTDAIYTLAASSKRPVIVVASNPNCSHLQRLMNQNTIKFTTPNALSVSKYLAVLSLLENCPVSLDDLISLYLHNNQDMRKTLHELQFFIQSGGDGEKQTNEDKMRIQKDCIKQRTPQKNSNSSDEGSKPTASGKYYASPSKQNFDQETSLDDQLKRELATKDANKTVTEQDQKSNSNQADPCHIHRTLFEFYTVDQNAKWRIPFPVNFELLYVNLNDIFGVSKALKDEQSTDSHAEPDPPILKRKTRSPKKVWLSNATAGENSKADAKNNNKKISSSPFDCLNTLSAFYGNVSAATLLMTRDDYRVSKDNMSQQQYQRDRLMPYLSEHIAHDLLERAIDVNLQADICPYNLFDAPKKRATVTDLMGSSLMMQGRRARSLDYEPSIRTICRSEMHRAAQERRSTRFYHYLRNSCVDVCNFSQNPFDKVCSVFEEPQSLDGGNEEMAKGSK